MADENEDRSAGFDSSKPVTDGFNDQSVASRLAKKVARTHAGSSAMRAALRGVGELSAINQATKALAPHSRIQEKINSAFGTGHFAQIAAQQDMMKSLLPDIQAHLSAMSGVSDLIAQQSAMKDAIASITALPKSWANIYGLSATARLAEEMRERHAFYLQPASVFDDLHKDVFAGVNESFRALVRPKFNTLEALRIDRVADAFSRADVFKSLGMASVLDTEMRSVTSLLNEHMSAIKGAGAMAEAIRAATFPGDAFGAIEGLLARSLKAQEELLAEHRASEPDATKEASFHRHMATLAAVINILMFLMTVALQLEYRLSDDDAVVRENTRAISEMSESFGAMALQIEKMQAAQVKADEAEQAADAAIVDILRDIAETLEAQAGSVDSNDKGK